MTTYKIGDLVERIEHGNGTCCPIGTRATVIKTQPGGMENMVEVTYEYKGRTKVEPWLVTFMRPVNAKACYQPPTPEEIIRHRREYCISLYDAKKIMERRAMLQAVQHATTVDDLKTILVALINHL